MALTKITNSAIADDIGLGGNPTTSTQTAGDSTTRIATTAFVSTAVANLVDSAPDTLNTLAELATSIGNSTTLSSTLTSSIATKLPLAGGTLTGGLTGTTGTFSGALSSGAITSSGDVSVIETGHAKVLSNSVGDYFPSINISRTSASTKLDYEWEFQVGSSGFLNFKDQTNSYYPIILKSNGDVALANNTSGASPLLLLDQSAASATFAGNIAVTGTVDGVDIAARDAVLTSTTTTAGAALPKAGGTMTGALVMGASALTLNGSLGTWSVNAEGARMSFGRNSANYINATHESGYLVFQTSNGETALTLNSSQEATFTNKLSATEVNIGAAATNGSKLRVNGKIVAGDASSTSGDVLLEGYYGNGATVVIGSERSSGGMVLGYGLQPSTTTQGQFLSSTPVSLKQAAYTVADTHKWYTATSNTAVAVGSQVTTMAERMRIKSDGYVGIGTDNPLYKLVISNSGAAGIEFGPEYAGDTNLVQHYDRTASAYMDVNNIAQNHRFGRGNVEHMRINSTGNVGIGTSTGVSDPVSRLNVRAATNHTTGSDREDLVTLHQGISAWQVGRGAGIRWVGDVSRTMAGISSYIFGNEETGLAFETGGAGSTGNLDPTTRMVIDHDGNVGIGTDSPESLLTIQNDDAGIRLRSNTTTAKGLTLRYNHAGNFGQLLVDHQGNNQLAMKYYALSHSFGRSDSDVNVTMDDSGRLLVGSTTTDASSSERFLVSSTGSQHSRFVNAHDTFSTVYIKNTSTTANTNQPFLTFQDTGGNRGNFGLRYSTAQLVIQGHGGVGIAGGGSGFTQDPDLFVNSSGKVGIGTSSPAKLLTVHYDAPAYDTVDDVLRLVSKFTSSNNAASAYAGSGPAIVFAGGIGDNQTRDRARIIGVYEGANQSGLSFHTQDTADIITEKMRITSAQLGSRVGIGTDNPGSKLEVYNNTLVGNTQLHIHNDKTGDAGVLRIEGARTSSNDAAQILLANGGSIGSAIKMYTSGQEGDLRFYTSPANSGNTLHERIRITTSGSFKHLSGAGTLEFAPLGGSSNLIEGGGSIKIKAAGGSVDLLNGTLESLNTTAQGITVNGPNSADLIINAPTDNASLSIKAGTSDSGAEEAVVTFYQNTSPKWQMGNITTNEFRLYNYATSSAAILVDTSGNVGIGTATPSRKLSVKRDTTITSGFNDISEFVDTTIGAGGSVSLNVGRANSTKNLGKMAFKYAGSGSNSNALNFGFYDADNLMTLTAGGNVGIGLTDGLGSTLAVQGSLRLLNGHADLASITTATGSVVASGSITHTIGYSGTYVTGKTWTWTYAATSWKSFHVTLRVSGTAGFSTYEGGGYNNNGGPMNTVEHGNDLGSFVVTRNGQNMVMTYTAGTTTIHPFFELTYRQSGGDGAPYMDRLSLVQA